MRTTAPDPAARACGFVVPLACAVGAAFHARMAKPGSRSTGKGATGMSTTHQNRANSNSHINGWLSEKQVENVQNVHVHGVRESDGECLIDDLHPQFFTVYRRDADGTSEALDDFTTHAAAMRHARAVASGLRVVDYVENIYPH
ncbi:hypothetical protein [Burkholderia vietnamiensis]|uniref:hypothetical protein n=1 Tax=Burkholderia vietnamiensis TaxID=60552 RepID=UPI00158BB765|nr:hypothetical protein [Burkholderia vietnamiensis]